MSKPKAKSDMAAGQTGAGAKPGSEYRALDPLIGKWMTEGKTAGDDPLAIVCSDGRLEQGEKQCA